MTKFFKKHPSEFVIVFGFLVILTVNALTLKPSLTKIIQLKHMIPLLFQGYIFEPLQEPLDGIPYIGYVTDKDIHDPETNKRFSQAQYILAPTILDPEKTDYAYLLLDGSSPAALARMAAEYNVEPVKKIDSTTRLVKRIK